MPQGKGTYGSKVGRPPKKKGSLLNSDRERYGLGGQAAKAALKKIKSLLGKKGASAEKNKLIEEIKIIEDYYDANIMYDFDDTPAARKFNEKIQKKFKDLEPKFKEIVETTEGAEKIDWESGALETINELIDIKEAEIKNLGGTYRSSLSDLPREQKQEGGEQETHIMPDGTEMAGATHEEYEKQMEGLMDKETPMLPDEEMEADYVDFVVDSTLSEEDQSYLDSALAKDDRLSELFDEVVESASEFSGSGPIEGPGTEVSDSIPARLSDGEFVFTAKAVDEIGADVLQQQMEDAEFKADERQGVAYGGVIDEEDQVVPIQTRGSVAAQGNVPSVIKQPRKIEEEMLKSSPRRYYVPVSG